MISWYGVKRAIRFWWQRRTRGWDDSDTWGLDVTAAEWLAPRLRRFIEIRKEREYTGCPGKFCKCCDFDNERTKEDHTECCDEWDKVLAEILWSVEHCAKDGLCEYSLEDEKRMYAGLEMLGKYWCNLWW